MLGAEAGNPDLIRAGSCRGNRENKRRQRRGTSAAAYKSPAEFVIDAGADQILGERHRAECPGSSVSGGSDGSGLVSTGRTADREQIDVEIFQLDADCVIKEVFHTNACRPAERGRWIVVSQHAI
jgi:hypothetical protein